MHLPAGQPPEQEAVDRAEGELAALGRARARPARGRAARRSWWPRNRDRSAGRCARCTSSLMARRPRALRHSSAVRRSCQTMACGPAAPVARSHSTVVSRWLVMPMAATSPADRPASASTPRQRRERSRARSPRDRARPSRAADRCCAQLALRGRHAARRRGRTGSPACWSCPGRSPGCAAPPSPSPRSLIPRCLLAERAGC